jgi:hypothetical protein
MTKPLTLQRPASPATITPDHIRTLLSQARQAVADAEREYRAAALDALATDQDADHSDAAAHDALGRARQEVTRLEAVLIEVEARNTADANKTAIDGAAAQDKASRAVFAAQAKLAKEGEAIIAAYAQWWAKLLAGDMKCREQFAINPRLRRDLAHAISAPLAVSREISRVAVAGSLLPPGADQRGPTLSDRTKWAPMGHAFADIAGAVLPASPATY